MDDVRLGGALRALRVRRGWRQLDLAERAGVSRGTVSRIERGHLDELTFRAIRAVAAALEARLETLVRWRGGDLDRLVNRHHSALHESFARRVASVPGWILVPEVSFSIYGERGVIDVLAWHAATGTVLVVELKTQLVDIQEHLGTFDRKVRLARRIAQERGWACRAVGAWLVVAPGRTNRRRIDAHRAVLRNRLPAAGAEAMRWLVRPAGELRALSQWPDTRQWPDARQGALRPELATIRRVRRPADQVAKPATGHEGVPT